jgi:hypothetical protein
MSAVAPTVTVTASPSSVAASGAINVTVAVSGGAGVPTGTVGLTHAATGYSSAAAALVNGSVVITVPAAELAVGNNTLVATYNPDVNSEAAYTTATGTASVTVTAVSLVPCKLQGYKAQLGYLPPSGGAMQLLLGVKNLDGEFSADELDSTDHSGSWKSRMYGLLDFTATAEVDYIAGDVSQEALFASLLGRVPVQIALFPTDASGSGVDQYAGTVVIGNFKWNGKVKDLQGATFSMKNASGSGFSVSAQ